ncbi:MAG: hypothetical protein LV471_04830 [Nitrosomonas sp.]|nr:hypothetical protein [Nitrosomonas sp.]
MLILQGSAATATPAGHDAKNDTQDAFKSTFDTIVSDPFLESIKRTAKTMWQIVAVEFCNPVLSFI